MVKNKSHELYQIWSKVPVDYYQQAVKTNLLQRVWHHLKIKSAIKILKSYSFENCLDFGCASGYMISQIAAKYPHVKYWGVDVYDKAIIFAKEKYPHINFKIASEDKLKFKDSDFDLIISYETIEHVTKPLATLKELRRILKPNGVLILAMDSGNWLFRLIWFFWENTKGRIWQGAHLHPFHHQQLEKLVNQAGFKIKAKVFTHLGMEVTFILTK